MKFDRIATLGFFGIMLFGGVENALAAPYSFTTIDYPGAFFTVAMGINNAGQIVGFSSVSNDGSYLLSDGSFTLVRVPDSALTRAYGINNGGQIAGTTALGGGAIQGFPHPLRDEASPSSGGIGIRLRLRVR
jgi:hypothetical protein